MKKSALKKSLLIGFSILCVMYAGVAQATATHYLPIHITGLSKFMGQYVSVFYVNAGEYHALNVKHPEYTSLKVMQVFGGITEKITADSFSIESKIVEQDGARAANGLEVVIHNTPAFDLLKSESPYGLINATAEYERVLKEINIETSPSGITIFHIDTKDFE